MRSEQRGAKLFPRKPALSGLTLGLALIAGTASAQAPVDGENSSAHVVPLAASTRLDAKDAVTQELIQILTRRGLLTEDDAEHLIGELREQAAKQVAEKTSPAPAAAAPSVDASASASAPEPDKKGPVRVIYLPETEKKRMRDEVKQEVLASVQQDNWAQPQAVPAWVKRIQFEGDFRFRYERDLFDSNNDPFFINYGAINAGAPYDVSQNNTQLPPLFNTTQNRELPRVRARLGLNAAVADQLRVNFRLATGNASGNATYPVSTNQTLGGGFNEYKLVFDRAYLEYKPLGGLALWLGRMPNPWQSTTELVWDADLNFDGVAARYEHAFGDFTPFVTAGGFSIENTTFDFPATQSNKAASRDKWLYAAQTGANWKLGESVSARFAVAYYWYTYLRGKLSSPCLALSPSDSCNSDDSTPAFVQKGNTLFAIRNLAADPSNPDGPQYQYFGLASSFRELNGTAHLDVAAFGPIHAVLDADYVYNLAYSRANVKALVPVNNYASDNRYSGGNLGFLFQALVGYPELSERWQWQGFFGYRRVESDAVVDAFVDSDFHLGGTNAKGYWVGGGLGFAHDAWLNLRWLSATEVTGPPLAIDILQVDLNARF